MGPASGICTPDSPSGSLTLDACSAVQQQLEQNQQGTAAQFREQPAECSLYGSFPVSQTLFFQAYEVYIK